MSVKIKRNCPIQGKDYKAGEIVEFPDRVAQALIVQGLAEPVTTAKTK